MLTEQEQKMITQALETVNGKIDNFVGEQKEFKQEMTQKFSEVKILLESQEKYLKGMLENQDKYLKGMLELQDKRITETSTSRNFQQNWFLGIVTLLIGTVVTVLVKFGFFN